MVSLKVCTGEGCEGLGRTAWYGLVGGTYWGGEGCEGSNAVPSEGLSLSLPGGCGPNM